MNRIYRALIGSSADVPDESSWAVLIGDMTFEPGQPDVLALERMAGLARRTGAPFLAGGTLGSWVVTLFLRPPIPRFGIPRSVIRRDVGWEALRRHPDAAYLGLTLPRFLLRLPYGRAEAHVESFDFEELTPDAGHEAYLWGNSAFLVAELLGRSFRRSGGAMRPGEIIEVEGLPIHIARRGGEASVVPCAEVLLSDRAAEIILDGGLMPLLLFETRMSSASVVSSPSPTHLPPWQGDGNPEGGRSWPVGLGKFRGSDHSAPGRG